MIAELVLSASLFLAAKDDPDAQARQALDALRRELASLETLKAEKLEALEKKEAERWDARYRYLTVHEALGIARGQARVRFGGDQGKEFEISAGDIAILPAGTGHQCLSASGDFCVIGAYPPGSKMEITRATQENHAKALKTIPKVAVPKTDPVLGADGPLVRLWKR